MQVNMQEAKSQLSRLGKAAWAGEDVVIAKAGEPYLRLVPYQRPQTERKPSVLKGQIWMAPDFDETPSDVIDLFWNWSFAFCPDQLPSTSEPRQP